MRLATQKTVLNSSSRFSGQSTAGEQPAAFLTTHKSQTNPKGIPKCFAILGVHSKKGLVNTIYTVRDYGHLNSEHHGTLTGIEKYSQEEFDEHTQAGMSGNQPIGNASHN